MAIERGTRKGPSATQPRLARVFTPSFTVHRARRRFRSGRRPAVPAVLVDARDRVLSTSGDLEPYLGSIVKARGTLFDIARADVAAELHAVLDAARASRAVSSGFVILLRRNALACKLVARPLELDGESFVSIAFEAPLAALAATLER